MSCKESTTAVYNHMTKYIEPTLSEIPGPSVSDLVPSEQHSSGAPHQQPTSTTYLGNTFFTDHERNGWLGFGLQERTISSYQHLSQHRKQTGQHEDRRSLVEGFEAKACRDLDRSMQYTWTSRVFAPWDENENLPQAASNSSSGTSRLNQPIFAHALTLGSPRTLQRASSYPTLAAREPKTAACFRSSCADETFSQQTCSLFHPRPLPVHHSSSLLSSCHHQDATAKSEARAKFLDCVKHGRLDSDDAQHQTDLSNALLLNYLATSTTASVNSTPTRYIKISNVFKNSSPLITKDLFQCYGDLHTMCCARLKTKGQLFLAFFDIRHAMNALIRLPSHPLFKSCDIAVEYSTKAVMSQMSPEILDDENEGRLSITIAHSNLTTNTVVKFLTSQGDVKSFDMHTRSWPFVTVVDYFDTRHAKAVKSSLQDMSMNHGIDCQVVYCNEKSDISYATDPWSPTHYGILRQRVSAIVDSPVGSLGIGLDSGAFHKPRRASPTPLGNTSAASTSGSLSMRVPQTLSTIMKKNRHAQGEDDNVGQKIIINGRDSFSKVPIGRRESSPKAAKSRSSSAESTASDLYAVPDNSQLALACPDADSAQRDMRTTFMIRNIPNKYTQKMLVDCINETHFGKFDFLYLRIDFKNKCNVGYAFINFVSVDVVQSFIEGHVGKKWSRFNSDKICGIAHAQVQGRQQLIEKFRNSSVMNEDPSWRPKIFYTSGLKIGQEEPFPAPNGTVKGTSCGSLRRRA